MDSLKATRRARHLSCLVYVLDRCLNDQVLRRQATRLGFQSSPQATQAAVTDQTPLQAFVLETGHLHHPNRISRAIHSLIPMFELWTTWDWWIRQSRR